MLEDESQAQNRTAETHPQKGTHPEAGTADMQIILWLALAKKGVEIAKC